MTTDEKMPLPQSWHREVTPIYALGGTDPVFFRKGPIMSDDPEDTTPTFESQVYQPTLAATDKQPPVVPPTTGKSYQSFSGIDLKVFVNDQPVGNAVELSISYCNVERKSRARMKIVLLHPDDRIKLYSGAHNRLKVIAHSEFGVSATLLDNSYKFESVATDFSVDTIALYTDIVFVQDITHRVPGVQIL